MKINKTILIIAAIILVAGAGYIIAISTGSILFSERTANQSKSAEFQSQIVSLKSQLDQNKASLTKAESDLSKAQSDLLTKTDEAAILNTNLSNLQSKLASVNSNLSKVQIERDASIRNYNTATNLADDLKNVVSCSDSSISNIDYTSNQAVSNSLKTYLSDNSGSIDKATWETVWTNSKTTIHTITGKYKSVFLVTFEDSKMNNKPSVFSFAGSCFLDLPK